MNRVVRCLFLLSWLVLASWVCPHPRAQTGAGTGPSLDGTWRWTFTMPDGTVTQPKLFLETEDGRLSGTTSFRPGTETSITNALLRGNQLRFQVLRSRAGREIVTTYWGTWNGNAIRGKVESNWAGEKQTYDWFARRSHEGAEGVWKWTTALRGRNLEGRVRLFQEGEALTGYVPGSGRGAARRVQITRGSVKDGEIYFEIDRGTGTSRILAIYRGKQTGDSIKGTIETHAGGRKQEIPWAAQRED